MKGLYLPGVSGSTGVIQRPCRTLNAQLLPAPAERSPLQPCSPTLDGSKPGAFIMYSGPTTEEEGQPALHTLTS